MSIFKKISILCTLVVLLICLVYVSDIANLPEDVIIFEGETLTLNTIFGVNIETKSTTNPNIEKIENHKTLTVAADVQNLEDVDCTGRINLDVKLFGTTVKEISVNVIENTEVVPIGNLIGVKLYTNGVLVVGMSEISGNDNNDYKPYEGSGIEEGDVIVKIDEEKITCTSELTDKINSSNGKEMNITYIRDGETLNTSIKAVRTEDSTYKIGLWVRDTAAGVRNCNFL